MPLIKIKQLQRHYQMGQHTVKALDGVDLEVEHGEFLMIVGSSGSGKSTLMHILGLLDQADQGSFFLGESGELPTDDKSLSFLRNQHIGFVFQKFNLLNELSVLQNIALPLAYQGIGKEERDERAKKAAEIVGLGQRFHHRPSELSGGQNQRVAIARALVNQPDIIMADEPTGALDSKTGKEIMQLLHELNDRGHTIIMVTHDPILAEQGTRKISMLDGHIIGDDVGEKTLIPSQKQSKLDQSQDKYGLNFIDLLKVGYREGLLPHKMRSFLTMLGIIIGVSSVISMSSFSLGSKKKQADQIRALGANLVQIEDQKLENESLLNARIKGSAGLSRQDLKMLKKSVPGIQLSALSREFKMNPLYQQEKIQARLLGIEGDYLKVHSLKISHGRQLDHFDHREARAVALIGDKVAQQLGGTEQALGKIILLSGLPFRVVGILKNRNIDLKELEASSVKDSNYDILMPLESALVRNSYHQNRSEVDQISLQLDNEERLYSSGRALRRSLTLLHNGVEDFRIIIPMDLLKQKQQSQKLLDVLTICISSISLIVGGIGIMNIMLATVNERIREIGVRRAVGATEKDIQYQFLSEAMILSVTGGLIGIVLSFLIVSLACYLLALPLVFSPSLIIISLTASILTGLGFGLYPAMQAARKNPVEALNE